MSRRDHPEFYVWFEFVRRSLWIVPLRRISDIDEKAHDQPHSPVAREILFDIAFDGLLGQSGCGWGLSRSKRGTYTRKFSSAVRPQKWLYEAPASSDACLVHKGGGNRVLKAACWAATFLASEGPGKATVLQAETAEQCLGWGVVRLLQYAYVGLGPQSQPMWPPLFLDGGAFGDGAPNVLRLFAPRVCEFCFGPLRRSTCCTFAFRPGQRDAAR